ncbi:MAG TPA: FAD-dependent oxidoreductase [Candidatus Krumholzibacteria bacterium]|nr:FAD-dependent oxidoreductase [Candidatus Krumholzibacteria bacterium]HRX51165.1 FAD-dependent oxidoreductase [Candidatus Krumholzibacteria bacterium]
MIEHRCDILVIGAGPAGLAAAAEAANRGLDVVLLERDPRHPIHRLPLPGVSVAAAHGRLDGPGVVTGEQADGVRRRWRAAHVILAAGDRPHRPNDVPDALPGLLAADAPVPTPVPPTVLVAGGGPAGVAAALRWREAGARVILACRTARLLPGLDADLAAHLTRRLQVREVDVRPRTRLVSLRADGPGVAATLRGPGSVAVELAAACAMLAVGRRAASEDLGLDGLPVVRDRRGRLQTDPCGLTAVPGLWAVGGLTGTPTTERTARAEGRAAVAAAVGEPAPPPAWDHLPRHLPEPLQAAAVGLDAEEAAARGWDVAAALGERDGSCAKLVAEREGGRLLGAFLAGPTATADVEGAAALMAAGEGPVAWAHLASKDPALALALQALAADLNHG